MKAANTIANVYGEIAPAPSTLEELPMMMSIVREMKEVGVGILEDYLLYLMRLNK